MPGPSTTTRPSTAESRSRASRTAAMASPSRASPSRWRRARAASVLARIAPAGLVVAVASTPASRRAGSSRSVRASTRAAWLHAGNICALTEGRRAQLQRVPGQVGVETEVRGPGRVHDERYVVGVGRLREPGTSPTVPRYDGSPTSTARASGYRVRASATVEGATPRGSPVPGSTSGRTQTGSIPASTRPRSIERCKVRLTTTRSPSPPSARAMDWLACVGPSGGEPADVGSPQPGRPGLRLGEQSAGRLHGVQARVQRDVARDHVADQVVALLVARDRERRRGVFVEAQPGVEQRRVTPELARVGRAPASR